MDDSLTRLNVCVPRGLYRQFRLHALEQGTTVAALVTRMIRQELMSDQVSTPRACSRG
jgi:hypothetical protein